jgi:hypothetical protein
LTEARPVDAESGAETNLLLLAVAGGAIIMGKPGEDYWWLAPVISGIAVLLAVWFNWGKDWHRRRRMRKPFRLELVRPPGTSQDDMVRELLAPPDSEFSIQLRVWPLLEFDIHEIVFGFVGDQDRRPVPQRAFNEFIKIGTRRKQVPGVDDGHLIDYSDNYHIREDRAFSKPNNYTYGFLVQTREPGLYPIRFEIITDCGEALPVRGVFLSVEPRKNT